MVSVIALLTVAAAAVCALRIAGSRETRLVQSVIIDRPGDVVFNVVSSKDRWPAWQRKPYWMPSPLRVTLMKPLGNGNPAPSWATAGPGGSEEISVRCLKNREFGYKSVRRRDLSFESTFHLVQAEGGCQLVWELRYSVRRLPDLMAKPLLDAAVRDSMNRSLEWLRRLALITPDAARPRSRMYEARRDQVPAA